MCNSVEDRKKKVVSSKPRSEVSAEVATITGQLLKEWSAPYRNWHYYPDHVVPPSAGIKGLVSKGLEVLYYICISRFQKNYMK